jgi:two-component system nitrogen regulation sensor histidine kinase NtrY
LSIIQLGRGAPQLGVESYSMVDNTTVMPVLDPFRESEADQQAAQAASQSGERKKRKRELWVVLFSAVLFLGLTWFEIRLFGISQQLPFVHSIFFFGLVNFNIVLFLFMAFMIFRNLVKVFVERRSKILGSSLKAKLIAAFVGFATVPTVLIFATSSFYINNSFDKWFSVKMAGVLKSSLEVTNAYYFNAKKRNYHFAHQIANELGTGPITESRVKSELHKAQKLYNLDAVEFYPALFSQRQIVISDDETIPVVPNASLEFLQKGLSSRVDSSTIHQFGEGNLVRVIVPVPSKSTPGAVVVSSFVPLSLISKMNDISSAYDEFRDVNPLQYPLKSIYLIILLMMTLVILLAAVWFGFYLAKQISTPIALLGRASKRIADGDYAKVVVQTGSEEMANLVENFNQMSSNLEKSESELQQANGSLRTTLSDLDEHSRYIEVVLGNVSAGVISVDKFGKVTTVNKHAGNLLKLNPVDFIGRSVRELLTLEYFRTFSDLLKTMAEHNVETIQRELKVNIDGESLPILMTLSILKNEQNEEVGKIVVFDDMTPIVNAQRAVAWTEVARRIAHEIKNPLTPIRLSAERLQRKFKDQIQDPAFQECTTMIIKQTEDLKNLVNEFSNFARLPQAKMIVTSLAATVEEAVMVFRASHPQVEILFQQENEAPEFKFDPDQIKRVLVNLIDNSIAAILGMELPPGEVPRIDIRTKYDSELRIMRLDVSDNGPGIPAHQRARVFEPYFSTKASGTGLGLAIVRRIIEDHSGFIRALPHSPRGTKMVIELPVNEIGAWKPQARSDK